MDSAEHRPFHPLSALPESGASLLEDAALTDLTTLSRTADGVGISVATAMTYLAADAIDGNDRAPVSALLSALRTHEPSAQDETSVERLLAAENNPANAAGFAGLVPQQTMAPAPDAALVEQQLIAALGARTVLNLRDSDVSPLPVLEKAKPAAPKRSVESVRRKTQREERDQKDDDQQSNAQREELLGELFERSLEAERSHHALDL